jgi:hypothetical protein
MTTRRIGAPMLYARNARLRWPHILSGAMDEAAAAICRTYWRHGGVAAIQPERIERISDRVPVPGTVRSSALFRN